MINILWIEDNPLLSKNIIIIDNLEYLIPSLSIDKNLKTLFNLKVLQHPEEIKEYLELCNDVVTYKAKSSLADSASVIPDIIVFDYMLSENFNSTGSNSVSYSAHNKPVRVIINPNYEIKEAHEDIFKDKILFSENCKNYSKECFLKKINEVEVDDYIVKSDILNSKNDEFGLYSGISILRFYKDHITCAVPATFKESKTELATAAKYFEWLNEYDLKNAFSRENRSDKKWNKVLAFGTEMLRNRILEQAKQGKIWFNVNNLISVSKGESSFIEITSSFSIKEISLKALFFCSDEEQVKVLSKEFANHILEIVITDLETYVASKEIADKLWNTYQSRDTTYRLQLSELSVRYFFELEALKNIDSKTENERKIIYDKINLFKLNQKEKSNLEQYEKYFKIFDDKIRTDKVFYGDFKLITKGKSRDVKRLVVFFTIINLINKYLDYRLNNKKIKCFEAELIPEEIALLEPDADDLLIALYPIAQEPIMLPIHLGLIIDYIKEKPSVVRQTLTNPIYQSSTRGIDIQVNDLGKMLDITNQNLTDTECKILSNYIITICNKNVLESKYCPKWLNELVYGIYR